MSILRKLASSRMGPWLYRLMQAPVTGPVLRVVVRLIKKIEYTLVRFSPSHRAHDRTQNAVLAAFERNLANHRDSGSGGRQ